MKGKNKMTITKQFEKSTRNKGERLEKALIKFLGYHKPENAQQNTKGSEMPDLIAPNKISYQVKTDRATLTPPSISGNKLIDFIAFTENDVADCLLFGGWWKKRLVVFTFTKENAIAMIKDYPEILHYDKPSNKNSKNNTRKKSLRLKVQVSREAIYTNYCTSKVELKRV